MICARVFLLLLALFSAVRAGTFWSCCLSGSVETPQVVAPFRRRQQSKDALQLHNATQKHEGMSKAAGRASDAYALCPGLEVSSLRGVAFDR